MRKKRSKFGSYAIVYSLSLDGMKSYIGPFNLYADAERYIEAEKGSSFGRLKKEYLCDIILMGVPFEDSLKIARQIKKKDLENARKQKNCTKSA